MKQLLI